MQEERKIIVKLMILITSMYGVILGTAVLLKFIIANIMIIGHDFPIISFALCSLFSVYLLLAQLAYIGLSLIYSNVKDNFIAAYTLRVYKKFLIN